MFCPKCGKPLADGARFCRNCGFEIAGALEDGKKAEAPTEKADSPREVRVGGSGNIKLCSDGKYRWIYEFSMLKNPVILLTIWKIMAIGEALPALITLLSDLKNGFAEALFTCVKVYAITFGICLVLSVISYFILAGLYGWKYIVLFEMDEDGVVHIQQPKQYKKAQALGWLTALAGASAGNLTAQGAGLLAASKSASSSEFKKVRSVKGLRGLNTIKVNMLLEKNQVYAEKEDYDFVWSFITSRCVNAKKIK